MKLDGKVALITGGAKGIGLGIAKVFLKYGAKIIILDSDKSAILDTTRSLALEYGDKVIGRYADITKIDDLEEVKKEINALDIIVNNAGICRLDTFLNMDLGLRDKHIDINFNGNWNTTKVFLPLLKNSSCASIINLSSVTGPMVADSGESAYAASKAAVLGLTKALAMELAKDNIRVNAIMPGYVLTPMVEGMAKETNPDNPESVIEGIAKAIPLGRLANPLEIGELAAFLASNESSYITGQGIVIDGGSTLPETMSMGV